MFSGIIDPFPNFSLLPDQRKNSSQTTWLSLFSESAIDLSRKTRRRSLRQLDETRFDGGE